MTAETENETHEIEIEVSADVAVEPEIEGLPVVEKKPEEKPATPAPTLDDGIEEIKARLAEEQRQREEAQRRAQEDRRRALDAEQRATGAQTETRAAQVSLLNSAIEVRKQAREAAKARMQEAYAAQDFAAVTDIQDELAQNSAELLQLEQGKRALESAPKPVAPALRVSDPVAELSQSMEQGGFTRSAEWVRKHPEFVRDPQKYQKMLAAHNLAVADGIAPDTDAYFDSVETTLRIKQAEPAPAARVEIPVRESPPPAAPASRNGATVGNAAPNSKRITLTAAEVDMAESMGMTPKEYAQNKYELQKAGRLN